MPNNNNKKSFLLNLEKTIDTISTEVKNSLKLVQSDGPNSLDWLKKSMHPYFFAAFEDETEAVSSLVANLSSLSKNHQLVLVDREKTLILAKRLVRGSIAESIAALKDKNISTSYITKSYQNLPNIDKKLEIHRFDFDTKSDKEIAQAEMHPIPEKIKERVWQAMKKHYKDYDFEKYDAQLNMFWSNNERYIRVSSYASVARLMWLYQKTGSHGGIYFDMEKVETKEKLKETRIFFGVANPPQKQFLLQLIKIINRMEMGIHRAACIGISNGIQPYFLGSFCVTTKNGKFIKKESETYQHLKREFYNTQIFSSNSSSYNTLYIPGQMNGEDCSLVDAFVGFCHTNLAHNQPENFVLETVTRAFLTHIDISTQLIDLFKLRFDPTLKSRKTKYQKVLKETIAMIENHNTGRRNMDNHRRTIFKCCLSFIRNTLKTNFYVQEKHALSFRLDPVYLTELGEAATSDLPADRPFRITYFYGHLGPGFHIGFSDIARGGWRTLITTGRDDYVNNANTVFRENYVLAHTQHFKNKDIYEGGSKMVAILNAGNATDAEQIKHLLYKHQFGFINAFFDIYITENGDPVNPAVLDYYGEDEAIELGPDENMHDFMIETIADQAKKRGYVLGTGIMSSKKAGINHKEYGVTSTGVVKFAEVTLEELGIDMRKDAFSVKFTGGPNGDVAGNAMQQILDQCPKVKINMILDGTGAFFDPSGADHAELRRILLKDDLTAFNPKALHPGGFILYRQKNKMDGIRQLFKKITSTISGLKESWVSTDEFYREFDNMIFNVESDLFIPAGGRPETIDIKNYQRFFKKDGTLMNKAIVEGANSFITPAARVELQKKGMVVIRDASANKCGVISSSYETIANLLLSEEEFLANKEEYVDNVISILKKRAEDEARLIFKRYKQSEGDVLYTEVSDGISLEINGHYARLFDYFKEHIELCDQPLYQAPILAHLPIILRKKKQFKNRIGTLPDKYKAAILASEIASSMVYVGDNNADFIHMVEGHLRRMPEPA